MRRALDEYGRIDVVFANAGFGGPRGFGEGDVEHWKAMVLTNVYGAALTIRATLEALIETKGHLLLTGSVAGRRALPGSLYSATKWAVTGMGESARQDFNDTGVRVTLIEPGMVDTPFFDNPPEIEALEADDIARAVMFAVSQPAHVDVNEILIRPTTSRVASAGGVAGGRRRLWVGGGPAGAVGPARFQRGTLARLAGASATTLRRSTAVARLPLSRAVRPR